MKQNHTKRVYFSFFNPLKENGELGLESLGWVGELVMRPAEKRYVSFRDLQRWINN